MSSLVVVSRRLGCSVAWCLILLALLLLPTASPQRTQLDVSLAHLYRPLRLLSLGLVGRTGDSADNIQLARSLGRTQKLASRTRSVVEFCDVLNGPGRRSATPPSSVHRLRPGDIDIVGGLGDSLTAGNGIVATSLPHVIVENRGLSFSIGGQGTWREFITLPNILKEFNPDLYGYSLRDGLASDRSSRFNVAELGAMSRDVPYEAKVLVKRLRRDPRVNMTHHWKLVSLHIGDNDFCSDMCYRANPEDVIRRHELDMLRTYRYLRDNVPRLMLNVVPGVNVAFLTRMTGLPAQCQTTLRFECPCFVGKSAKQVAYLEGILRRWYAQEFEIAAREEFNTETFTINVQPFSWFDDFPRKSDGTTDFRYLSEDCFHLSQVGHAITAIGLWNNMLEREDEKSVLSPDLFKKFRCPTEDRPYVITRVNAKPGFQAEKVGDDATWT